ncbi:MAG: hypothetical protein IT376_16995 [Polyangiaceae bacterium]|nr:hypothetical protein [Polyangiaceae bacterium]
MPLAPGVERGMKVGAGARRLLGALGLVALAALAVSVAAGGGPRRRSAVDLCREIRPGSQLLEVVAGARAAGLDVVDGDGAPPGTVLLWTGEAPWRRFCVVRHRGGQVTAAEEAGDP